MTDKTILELAHQHIKKRRLEKRPAPDTVAPPRTPAPAPAQPAAREQDAFGQEAVEKLQDHFVKTLQGLIQAELSAFQDRLLTALTDTGISPAGFDGLKAELAQLVQSMQEQIMQNGPDRAAEKDAADMMTGSSGEKDMTDDNTQQPEMDVDDQEMEDLLELMDQVDDQDAGGAEAAEPQDSPIETAPPMESAEEALQEQESPAMPDPVCDEAAGDEAQAEDDQPADNDESADGHELEMVAMELDGLEADEPPAPAMSEEDNLEAAQPPAETEPVEADAPVEAVESCDAPEETPALASSTEDSPAADDASEPPEAVVDEAVLQEAASIENMDESGSETAPETEPPSEEAEEEAVFAPLPGEDEMETLEIASELEALDSVDVPDTDGQEEPAPPEPALDADTSNAPPAALEQLVETACKQMTAIADNIRSELQGMPGKVAKLVTAQSLQLDQNELFDAINVSLASVHDAITIIRDAHSPETLEKIVADKLSDLNIAQEFSQVKSRLEAIGNAIMEKAMEA